MNEQGSGPEDLYTCTVCGCRGYFPNGPPEQWHQIVSWDGLNQWCCGACNDPSFSVPYKAGPFLKDLEDLGVVELAPPVKEVPMNVVTVDYENPLLVSMSQTFDDCWTIAKMKNHDYSGTEDPLANFRECEKLGVTVAQGIMVRLTDKLARLQRLLHPDHILAVKDETLRDTIMDAINYLAILKYALENEHE